MVDRRQELARARRAERVVGPDGRLFAPRAPKHGTHSAVTYWYCQCAECTEFRRDDYRRRMEWRRHNDEIIEIIAALAALEEEPEESEEEDVPPRHLPPRRVRTGPRIVRKPGSGPRGNVYPTTWRELRARLEDLGCDVRRGKTHYKITLPDGTVTSMPTSASDRRSLPNQVHDLRKLGVDVRRTGRR